MDVLPVDKYWSSSFFNGHSVIYDNPLPMGLEVIAKFSSFINNCPEMSQKCLWNIFSAHDPVII